LGKKLGKYKYYYKWIGTYNIIKRNLTIEIIIIKTDYVMPYVGKYSLWYYVDNYYVKITNNVFVYNDHRYVIYTQIIDKHLPKTIIFHLDFSSKIAYVIMIMFYM